MAIVVDVSNLEHYRAAIIGSERYSRTTVTVREYL